MSSAQQIEIRRITRKNRKKTKNSTTGFIRLKIKDEFLYNIDPQHLKIIIDFIAAVDYIFISIYPSDYKNGIPYEYCIAVAKDKNSPCELWYILIDNNGMPEVKAYDLDELSVKNIHQRIFHQQFFHLYKIGMPLALPPLYSSACRNEIKNIDIELPIQLKEFCEIEN